MGHTYSYQMFIHQALLTALLINRICSGTGYFLGEASAEYFIGVNRKAIPINTTLLSIQSEGFGGTKISTVSPYTVLETSIYDAVVSAFTQEVLRKKVTIFTSMGPFGVCLSSTDVGSTRAVLSVYWRMFGANSMVPMGDGLLYLGFLDGGLNLRTSIVIGAHQIEDNLLEFDLAASRLGFSSSLLSRETTCANFNFTSNA
ncbi:hypothetical protein RJ639_035337 [Escallonia herrerae]|uniref:Xylanase inhibitor C-terminal domain-containing protein n=1 Tax=Escallonia herrerae TaxID=1293975 RepID=A0AA88WU16_9ASTE|nr:hypothetical protein RJ639_035337 [Escallonia herrerae]